MSARIACSRLMPVIAALALFWAGALFAQVTSRAPDRPVDSAASLAEEPEVEKRLIQIAEELRCLVCQNESLAGSRAGLAEDLRREVRGLIKQGKSDAEIREFLVSRYGDFVLYRPPVKPLTWLLWVGPFILGIGGLVIFLLNLRKRRAATAQTHVDQPLTEEEQRRARELLGSD